MTVDTAGPRRRADRGEWRKRLPIAAAGLLALLALVAFSSANDALLDRFRNLVFDGYQRVMPRPEAGAPVAVVDIDEASIDKLGQWPWPRTTIAQMVERLMALGAATIAFDIVFPEADRTSPSLAVGALERQGAKVELPPGLALDNDAVLAKSFAGNPSSPASPSATRRRRPCPRPRPASRSAAPTR